MSVLHYIFWFLVALGLLVAIHEYGHYLAARLCGVKVLRFSIGFGKPLFARSWGPDRTEWVLAAIPLGGYVKMLDEREAPVAPEERARAFNTQVLWKRCVIVLAGPVANFLLAILLYWGLFVNGTEELAAAVRAVKPDTPAAQAGFQIGERVERIGDETVRGMSDLRWAVLAHAVDKQRADLLVRQQGGDTVVRHLDFSGVKIDDGAPDPLAQLGLAFGPPSPPAVVARVRPGSPAERAGVQAGDRFLVVDGKPVVDWHAFVEAISQRPAQPTLLEVARGDRVLELEITPDAESQDGRRIGRIGVEMVRDQKALAAYFVTVQDAPLQGLVHAIRQTWDTSWFSLKMMWRMVIGEISLRNISGPVTIADYAGQTAAMGMEQYLKFIALVSISLGVLNLLPIPVLDGGHLLYYVAEFFRGRPLSDRVMEMGQRVGLAMIVMLSVLALFNDITRRL